MKQGSCIEKKAALRKARRGGSSGAGIGGVNAETGKGIGGLPPPSNIHTKAGTLQHSPASFLVFRPKGARA